MLNKENIKIAVIGLGYVGLPLAVEFGKKRNVIGFDVNNHRISNLKNGIDNTLEVEKKDLLASINLVFTSNIEDIRECNCFIVTVPTPIDENNNPDLTAIKKASELVGGLLKIDDIVIYESTVYPGCTEEFCVPILEEKSNLEFNKDFYCGYSPERINPGDKDHRLTNIVKVTSGSTIEASNVIDDLYSEIILAGTHKAQNIKVAEAAKVIENTQRDLNIALINELAKIFQKLGIDTNDVLDAAGTKWNFLPFKPGLVGGHCIGVDPFYLTYKAESVGYKPEVILAGRKVNDSMGRYVASKINDEIKDSAFKKALILGFTFKENCPDIRNTRVIDIYNSLVDFNFAVDVYDPWVDSIEVKDEYNIDVINSLSDRHGYDAIIVAVAHDDFKSIDHAELKSICKEDFIIFDLKNIYDRNIVDMRL